MNVSGHPIHQASIAEVPNARENIGSTSNGGQTGLGLSRKLKRALKNREFFNRKKGRFNLEAQKSHPNSNYQPSTHDFRPSSANNNQVIHGPQQSRESFATPGVQMQVQQNDNRQPSMPLVQYGQHPAAVPPARPFPNVWMDNRFNNPS